MNAGVSNNFDAVIREEKLAEARELIRDNLWEEYIQVMSDKEILEDFVRESTIEDLIKFISELDYTEHEEFVEHKEVMFDEYTEHRR